MKMLSVVGVHSSCFTQFFLESRLRLLHQQLLHTLRKISWHRQINRRKSGFNYRYQGNLCQHKNFRDNMTKCDIRVNEAQEAGGVRGLGLQREVRRCKELMFSKHVCWAVLKQWAQGELCSNGPCWAPPCLCCLLYIKLQLPVKVSFLHGEAQRFFLSSVS